MPPSRAPLAELSVTGQTYLSRRGDLSAVTELPARRDLHRNNGVIAAPFSDLFHEVFGRKLPALRAEQIASARCQLAGRDVKGYARVGPKREAHFPGVTPLFDREVAGGRLAIYACEDETTGVQGEALACRDEPGTRVFPVRTKELRRARSVGARRSRPVDGL